MVRLLYHASLCSYDCLLLDFAVVYTVVLCVGLCSVLFCFANGCQCYLGVLVGMAWLVMDVLVLISITRMTDYHVISAVVMKTASMRTKPPSTSPLNTLPPPYQQLSPSLQSHRPQPHQTQSSWAQKLTSPSIPAAGCISSRCTSGSLNPTPCSSSHVVYWLCAGSRTAARLQLPRQLLKQGQ